MMTEISKQPIPYILSDVAQKAYEKIKTLILKIFSSLKSNNEEKNLKDKFYDSYIDFARKLKAEGYDGECYRYMSICDMYYHLIDRPEVLIAHEEFFMELFNLFDNLLSAKINNSEKYPEILSEFKANFRKKRRYFYTQVAIPSEHYNEDILNEITGHLAGGIK